MSNVKENIEQSPVNYDQKIGCSLLPTPRQSKISLGYRLEDGSVESGPDDAEAGSNLDNRDVGCF